MLGLRSLLLTLGCLMSFSFILSKDTDLKFYNEVIELSANETHVIPFFVSQKATTDKTFKTVSQELDILQEAQTLKGYDIGFIRVKTRKSGKASLTASDTLLKINVKEASTATETMLGKPEIQTPSNGSFCYGEITVGVLVLNDLYHNPLTSQSVVLQDQNGTEYLAIGQDSAVDTFCFYQFIINCDKLKPGPLKLTAKSTNQNGRVSLSKTISVVIVESKNDKKIVRECENQIDPEKRLERWGKKSPKLGSNPDASGGQFVLNYGADPVNAHDIEISETGYYQFFIRARGDKAGGAYPSIGIFMDKKFDFLTAGRLTSFSWHRVALGIPIYIEKGTHQFALRFLNDFWAKDGIDRNLYLDQVEMIKIEPQYTNTLVGLEVALLNNIHGNIVRDELSLQGRTKWDKEFRKIPPKVSLEVNGRVVSSMFAGEPHFSLNRNQLQNGANIIQLSAQFTEDSGKKYSVSQTIYCAEITPTNDQRIHFYEFAVLDPIWNGVFEETLEVKNQYSEIALIKEAGEYSLKLPENIEGNFTVGLDARGEGKDDSFGVSISAEGAINLSDADNKIASGWWRFIELGKIEAKVGAKTIKFKLNKSHLKENQSAKILLRGLVLRLEFSKADEKPPFTSIVYPTGKETLSGSFMVVAKAIDDIKLDQTDLIFDGQPSRQIRYSGIGLGYYYFMVPDFMNTPGTHRLMISTKDKDGNLGESREISYKAEVGTKSKMTPYERALHLSERFCYGADQDVIAEILIKGEKQWLTNMLNTTTFDPGVACSLELSNVMFPNYYDYNHAPMSVIKHLAKTSNPAQARFTIWAQNHFSTWLNKVEPQRKRQESNFFFEKGISSYKQMLNTSSTSPAMLFYLDQQRSWAGQLNENYARELLELHTLSVTSGYSQEDVTKLASLITGWMTNDVADLTGKPQRMTSVFYFDQNLNDSKATQILGMNFPEAKSSEKFDRINKLFEMLSSHPNTAEFITKKLLQQYTGIPVPAILHANLQKEFMRTGGDMKCLLAMIASSDDFWASRFNPKVCTPLDFSVATMRRSEEPDIWQMHECARNSGVGLFDRATPDGYPETNKHYADSNSLLQRWRFCDRIQWHLYRNLPERLQNANGLDKDDWMQRMIQVSAMNLMGKPLGAQSYEAVKSFYLELDGQPYEKALKLTSFIGKLPEANLR